MTIMTIGSAFIPAGPLQLPRLPSVPSRVWPVPGSKLITNRALVVAALTAGPTVLEGALDSEDTAHVHRALEALGVAIERIGPTALRIEGGRDRLRPPARPIDVGNSTSAARFVTAVAAVVDGPVTIDGDAASRQGPISDLLDGIQQLGVAVDCPTGSLPVTVQGRGRLSGGSVAVRGDRSSQFASAILIIAGLADADVEVVITGSPVGRAYLDLTCRIIRAFGGHTEHAADHWRVRAIGGYRPTTYRVEPDASSASHVFSLAAGSHAAITVANLGGDSIQGDATFVDLMGLAGARVERRAHETVVTGTGVLRGVDADMSHRIDTVISLAALAPLASGPTTIRNVAELRVKGFDRLAATATELSRLGQHVRSTDDGLEIIPRPICPGMVTTHRDHQLAMGFAVLGALRGGIVIDEPSAVAKSYPAFWRDLAECYHAAGVAAPW